MKQDLRVQVKFGDDAKYLVVGVGTIPFQLESNNTLDFDDILFFLSLKKNLLSVLITEIRVMRWVKKPTIPHQDKGI